MVTSGPFNITNYEPGELIELTRNVEYFHYPHLDYSSNPSDTGSTNTSNGILNLPLVHIFVTIPSIVIIFTVAVKWKLEKNQ